MSPKKISLSVIVIAKNEEARVGDCLDAVQFASERLVLDNGSTDKTSDIAKSRGAEVKTLRSDDFAELRNKAAKLAHGEWILYIDADEKVSTLLAENIKKTIGMWKAGDASGFEILRENYYLGRRWPKSEWMLRLFRAEKFNGWHGALHETPQILGSVGRIDGLLIHNTHRTLVEMVEKTNEWSEIEARLRLVSDHPQISWWRLLRVMGTGFWNSFVVQGGWRVGTVGWIESIYQGFSMFITYAKLWEMQHKKN
jgi:glycosyltransferase involved in cell wall biosynthesis